MKRIMVMGSSAGAGKSTFAGKLGKKTGIEVYHLDVLYWKPGWVESGLQEFSDAQREIVKRKEWIMEGNYTGTFEIRAAACDTVIYLDLPLYICLWRVVKRRLTNLGKTRPDMAAGCREKLDLKFIEFIVTTYRRRKKEMAERLSQFKTEGKKVIVLKNTRDIDAFLNNLDGRTDKAL
ncbi:topology modulation protein [Cytobacillus firmus]|uniref:topology modulation protein n=1 Tax=Cytobacillus firmus TaxID=1399 RepID=UPI0018CF5CCD|nr:topology modulation protein [Cytobacillus firmus]MBG9656969.1 topology modulation protein [Cytobacillus firmus]MED1906418.1 topology modulation protein [Cytobacillus firmus]